MDNELNRSNINTNQLPEEFRNLNEKEPDKSVCPYCSGKVQFTWVHGHYQCPECRNVVIGCCGDE